MTSESTCAVALAALLLAGVAMAAPPGGTKTSLRIQPWPTSRRYWQYQGKPVLLLGGSIEDNLFQIPKLAEHLDTLKTCGGNYVRCTMSARDEGNVWPFALAEGEGGKRGKYDLDRWNPEYWKRFDTFLRETSNRGIIVQIELWATFDFYRDIWQRNPFNPAMNVNYTAKESHLPVKVDSHPIKCGNDFFYSVPKAKDLDVVRKYQERFVARLFQSSRRYGNVLYCMDNETSVTPEWGAYWAHWLVLAGRRGPHPTGVEVTEMWDKWDLAHKQHNATFDYPERYTFIDISQNNHQKGQTHYDNALKQWRRIAKVPRPLNNVKIYGADTGRFGNTRDGLERFWRNIFAGLASARFHRPDSGLGLSPLAQRMIRSARDVTGAFDLFACRPRPDLLSDRSPNEAYCLADPPRQYAVYFPAGGSVLLQAPSLPAGATLRWYDIAQGRWQEGKRPAGKAVRLTTPGKGAWAAVLR